MSKHIPLLSALLVLQLVITGLLFSADSSSNSNNEIKSLVKLNTNELSHIKVIEGDATLALTKVDNKWQLESYPELKLLDNNINSLTTELAAIKVSWPLTSTKNSHERFKVANDNFEKQVIFTDKDGNQQTLLFGESPSFKQIYARNLAHNEVYSINYSAYQLSADANSWLDKSMLSIDGISRVSHSVINLEKTEHDWQLAPPSSLGEQQALDTSAIEDFINQLTSLSVSGIAKEKPEPTNTLTVHNEQDKQYIYSFAANDDNYFVKREDINQWFKLSKSKFEQLADVSFEQFIAKIKEKKEEEPETLSE